MIYSSDTSHNPCRSEVPDSHGSAPGCNMLAAINNVFLKIVGLFRFHSVQAISRFAKFNGGEML